MAKKKKKKTRLKLKNIFICLLVLSLLGLTGYYILMLPINNIYIKGNNIIKESEILTLAKLDTYPSFLLTSKKEIKNNLKKNKYIESINVKKQLGNIITIEIKEQQPLCVLKNGKILLSNGTKLNNDYGLTDIPNLVNDDYDKKIENDFIKKFSKVEKNVLRQISQIEYSKTSVDNERFLLYMDDGNEVYITLTKIEKINKYNEIVEKMDGSHGIIYLDSGDYIEIKNITEYVTSTK